MKIEIINTGAELMLGRVLNSHHQWLCRQLADLGYTVGRQVAIDDSAPAIVQAVRDALPADLILVTGGLGPTSDDRTRTLIADLLGRKLHEDPSVVAHIEDFLPLEKNACPPVAGCRHKFPTVPWYCRMLMARRPGWSLSCPREPTGRRQAA